MVEFIGQPFFSYWNCRNPLAAHDYILSERFLGKTWPVYLFRYLSNMALGRTEDRKLIMGVYKVADVLCSNCGESPGWKYLRVNEEMQKCKKGSSYSWNTRNPPL